MDTNLLKRRNDTYRNLINRLDRMTSANYMHIVAGMRCTLKAMVDNNQVMIDSIDNQTKYKNKETGEIVTLIAKDVRTIGNVFENCGVNLYKIGNTMGVSNDNVIIINSYNEYVIIDSLYFEQHYEKIL